MKDAHRSSGRGRVVVDTRGDAATPDHEAAPVTGGTSESITLPQHRIPARPPILRHPGVSPRHRPASPGPHPASIQG
ncbi:hypothetical protein OJF2_11730 [Aquisphaera giovannonii]|uniref:Uncharacterized protein n=1 Tax=Aquisphaera giovannonii TaxID=406548 RepID=A0A5B9VX83_9BACT|nr:hypothetical protein OJF2_11730 [Aquisphaera giovannonii]